MYLLRGSTLIVGLFCGSLSWEIVVGVIAVIVAHGLIVVRVGFRYMLMVEWLLLRLAQV